MGDDVPLDPRAKWIGDRVCGLLRCKVEFFEKLWQVEEGGGDVVKKFLDDDACMHLFFFATAKELTVAETIPTQQKKKVAYCQKTAEVKLDAKSLDVLFDQCVIGCLNQPLLDSMHNMLRYVYLPIISKPQNTQGLSEVAMKAFADMYQRMLASVWEIGRAHV